MTVLQSWLLIGGSCLVCFGIYGLYLIAFRYWRIYGIRCELRDITATMAKRRTLNQIVNTTRRQS